MPVVPSKLVLEVKLPRVLPEVIAILEQMIELHNDWETSTYLKLESCTADRNKDSSTSARYELFKTKESLLEVIEQNCPAGCSIIRS